MLASPIEFPAAHLAAALAWPDQVGGLNHWSIHLDHAEDGTPYLTVDSSATSGNGFHLCPTAEGAVSISWDYFRRSTTMFDLIAAMNAILPLRGAALPGLV